MDERERLSAESIKTSLALLVDSRFDIENFLPPHLLKRLKPPCPNCGHRPDDDEGNGDEPIDSAG